MQGTVNGYHALQDIFFLGREAQPHLCHWTLQSGLFTPVIAEAPSEQAVSLGPEVLGNVGELPRSGLRVTASAWT